MYKRQLTTLPLHVNVAVEEMSPPDVCLFVNELSVPAGVSSGIDLGVIEPGVDTVDENINQVWIRSG